MKSGRGDTDRPPRVVEAPARTAWGPREHRRDRLAGAGANAQEVVPRGDREGQHDRADDASRTTPSPRRAGSHASPEHRRAPRDRLFVLEAEHAVEVWPAPRNGHGDGGRGIRDSTTTTGSDELGRRAVRGQRRHGVVRCALDAERLRGRPARPLRLDVRWTPPWSRYETVTPCAAARARSACAGADGVGRHLVRPGDQAGEESARRVLDHGEHPRREARDPSSHAHRRTVGMGRRRAHGADEIVRGHGVRRRVRGQHPAVDGDVPQGAARRATRGGPPSVTPSLRVHVATSTRTPGHALGHPLDGRGEPSGACSHRWSGAAAARTRVREVVIVDVLLDHPVRAPDLRRGSPSTGAPRPASAGGCPARRGRRTAGRCRARAGRRATRRRARPAGRGPRTCPRCRCTSRSAAHPASASFHASSHHPSSVLRLRAPFTPAFIPPIPQASSGRRGVLSQRSTPWESARSAVRSKSSMNTRPR